MRLARLIRRATCKHPVEHERWIENIVVPMVADGERVRIGGYVAQCDACGRRYVVVVG